jgi:hypothetical protein
MSVVLIHKATDLVPEMRAAVEAQLGRSLRDDEEVTIRTSDPHPAPDGEVRREIAERMRRHFELADSRVAPGTEEEIEKEINEALREVRPSYRDYREGKARSEE